jgi:hypothetical protein
MNQQKKRVHEYLMIGFAGIVMAYIFLKIVFL